MAPLLPKLRGHFAEFLNKGSPVRLGIFFSSTCVGLRYGHLKPYLAAFLASVDSSTSLLISLPVNAIAPSRRTSLSAATSPWTQHIHCRALTILLCHRFIYAILGGIGISTDCPSSTPLGLDLGPDLPWADEPSPGILRLSTEEFLAPLSLLMPAFSLVCNPSPLPLRLLLAYIAPLPIRLLVSPCFGVRF